MVPRSEFAITVACWIMDASRQVLGGGNMNIEAATQLSRSLEEILGKMDESVHLVMGNSSPEEFKAYRSAMGRAMGAFIHEVMNPHYDKYPETQPDSSK